jgi:hypothetical protein
VRFKPLALVPSVSGTAVALLASTGLGGGAQVVLASLGFVVTLGILFYEQRNTQLYDNVIVRAEHLEEKLELFVASGDKAGGVFASRKREPRRLFGVVPMRHDRGPAAVGAVALMIRAAPWLIRDLGTASKTGARRRWAATTA